MECTKKVLKISFIFLFFNAIFPNKVFALTQENITIDPIFQEITLVENQATASAYFTLKNSTNNTYTISFTSQDIQSMDENGNITLGNSPLAGTQNSVATYLNIPVKNMSLLPNSKLKIPITISNTRDLSPGGHYGAITTTLSSDEATVSGILPAVSSFILVKKIGGEQYHLSLNKILPNATLIQFPNTIKLTFSNLGNIHTTPRGIVKITNIFGGEVARAVINEGSSIILPQSSRTINSQIKKTGFDFPLMLYSLIASGSSDPGNVSFQSQMYFVCISPKSIILCIFTLIFFAVLVTSKRKKHA